VLLLLFGSGLPLKVNPSYLYTGQKLLPPKRDTDRVCITVDFKDTLAQGETITSAEWMVEKSGQPGVNLTEMVYSISVIDGTKVLQMIEGGESGASYEPYCIAFTSSFQKLSLPEPGRGILKVR